MICTEIKKNDYQMYGISHDHLSRVLIACKFKKYHKVEFASNNISFYLCIFALSLSIFLLTTLMGRNYCINTQ